VGVGVGVTVGVGVSVGVGVGVSVGGSLVGGMEEAIAVGSVLGDGDGSTAKAGLP
jgi:hypothetical protein